MDLASKLQLRPGQALAVIGAPEALAAELPASAADGEAVLAFVSRRAEIPAVAEPALVAAREDRLAWIAYPKGGQLGTDLNRDRLAAALADEGVQPVRQVSLDAVWSALRFRPA